jgi:putative transposase
MGKYEPGKIAVALEEMEAGGAPGSVSRRHGVSPATLDRWHTRYAGLTPTEIRRSVRLEAENRALKRLVRALLDDATVH